MRNVLPLAAIALALAACSGESGGSGAGGKPAASAVPVTPKALAKALNPTAYHPSYEVEVWLPAPSAFFVHDAAGRAWCIFEHQREADLYRGKLGPAPRTDWGWIRLTDGRITSVTLAHQTADGVVEDRYFMNGETPTSMKRTGRSAKGPWVTFTYAAGPDGALSLDAASRKILEDLRAKKRPADIADWPTYRSLSEMPVKSLLHVEGGKISMPFTCDYKSSPAG